MLMLMLTLSVVVWSFSFVCFSHVSWCCTEATRSSGAEWRPCTGAYLHFPDRMRRVGFQFDSHHRIHRISAVRHAAMLEPNAG